MTRLIVYEYGLRQPISGGLLVDDQIHLAHCYYNALIDAERERRAAIITAQESVCDVSEATRTYDKAKNCLEALMKWKRLSRCRGSIVIAPSKDEIEDAKSLKKESLVLLRAAKAEAKDVLAALYQTADEEYKLTKKVIRAAYVRAGLYWGTYLQVEQSIDQARKALPKKPKINPKKPWVECPSYRRWTGGGCVAVQIQSKNPLDDKTVFGPDTRLMIEPLPSDAFSQELSRGQRRRLQYTTVHLRVGSDGRRGPIWASWPLYMHRPLPEGAIIKWAKVIREPLHQMFPWRWRLQLTIEVPDAKPRPGNTMVAINLGWRLVEGGELRVATWADTNGGTGEMRLDRGFRNRIEKAESIRSTRDHEMDALRELLVEEGIDCSRWKSPKRFYRLLREMRFSAHFENSPGQIVDLLEDWAYRDRHLHWYERGCRRGAILYRREQYRSLALELCTRYPIVVVENYDLRPIVTDENRVGEPSAQRVEGAPYQARQCLKSTALRLGCTVIDGDSEMATQRCHLCGCEEPWDAAPSIEHTCPGCGERWDQDVNNAINMLASAVDAMKTQGALATGKAKRSAKFSKRHKNSGPSEAE